LRLVLLDFFWEDNKLKDNMVFTTKDMIRNICGYDAQILNADHAEQFQKMVSLNRMVEALVKRLRKNFIVFEASDDVSKNLFDEFCKRSSSHKSFKVLKVGSDKFMIVSSEKWSDNYIYGPKFMETI